MSSYYPPKLEPRPTAHALASDLPCHKCRENLRGLPSDGHCPKCGAAVSLSLHGDLIRYSDPAWIDRLRRGITTIIWGFILCVLGLAGAFSLTYLQWGDPRIPLVLVGVGIVMLFVGQGLLTSPDPSGLGEKKYGTSRKLTRVSLALSIVLLAIPFSQSAMTFPQNLVRWMPIEQLLAQIVGLVNCLAQLKYLSKLALRIRDTLLSERAHFLMLAIGICWCVWFTIQILLRPRFSSQFDDSSTDLLQFVYLLAGASGFVFLVMNATLLDKFNRRLAQQAKLAREAWVSAPTTP